MATIARMMLAAVWGAKGGNSVRIFDIHDQSAGDFVFPIMAKSFGNTDGL